MTEAEATTYFGNPFRMTKALGLKPNARFSWKDGIPALQQIRIEALTNGALRADDWCWEPAEPRFTKAEHREIRKTAPEWVPK